MMVIEQNLNFITKLKFQYLKRVYDFSNTYIKILSSLSPLFDLVGEMVDKISQLAIFFSNDILKEIVDRFLRNLKDGTIETRCKCERRNSSLSNVICEYYGVFVF